MRKGERPSYPRPHEKDGRKHVFAVEPRRRRSTPQNGQRQNKYQLARNRALLSGPHPEAGRDAVVQGAQPEHRQGIVASRGGSGDPGLGQGAGPDALVRARAAASRAPQQAVPRAVAECPRSERQPHEVDGGGGHDTDPQSAAAR